MIKTINGFLKEDEFEERYGSLVKVKEKSGMRKDRYSSIAYNYWCMCQLELKLKPKKQTTNLVSQLTIRPARRLSSFE